MAELKAWQDDLPDDMGDNLITSPFNEFVSTLDKMIKEFQKMGKGIDYSLHLP
ncbi:hypothetical protein ACFLW3_00560 [Chloroflexota bacterium]